MNEDEFWTHLRFRVMSIAKRPLGYCDWFEPKKYFLDGSLPRITGNVGFLNGPHIDEYAFTLFLNQVPGSWEGIEWAALLPRESAGDWLNYDRDCGKIEMRPAARVSPPVPNPDSASKSN